MAEERPLVPVIATGGTIANTSDGRLAITEVIEAVPELAAIARLQPSEVCRVGSAELRPPDWLEIGRAVLAEVDDDQTAGAIVTHGTFTHDETAFFLHLAVPTTKPIVVVSSQRQHGTLGNDGDRNFLDAVRVAIDPQSHGRGVMSVLNECVHSARDVVKTSPRPDGFRSRDAGLLGHVDLDRVVFYRSPVRRHTHGSEFDVRALHALPRVDIIYAYPGADRFTIAPLLEQARPRGLVLAGYSFAGMPAPDQLEPLEQAAKDGVAVVLANRGLGGRVPSPRSKSNTFGRGFITGDNLAPQKARVLLMLGLTRSSDHAELQRLFDEY